MKDSSNTINSLAQGKYPWGLVKNQTNIKFVEIGLKINLTTGGLKRVVLSIYSELVKFNKT